MTNCRVDLTAFSAVLVVQVPALALWPLLPPVAVVAVADASVAADYPPKAGRALRPQLGLVGQERKPRVAVVEPLQVLRPGGGGQLVAVAGVVVELPRPVGESSRK